MVSLTEWCHNKISALLVQPCTVQPVFTVFCSLCFKIWAVVFHYNQGRYSFLKHVKTEKWEAFRNEWVAVSESLCVCVWKRDRAETTASKHPTVPLAPTVSHRQRTLQPVPRGLEPGSESGWRWNKLIRYEIQEKGEAEIEGNRTPAGLCLSITYYTIWN